MRLICLSRAVDPRNGWGRVAYEILRKFRERDIEAVVFSVIGSTNYTLDGVPVHSVLRPDASGGLKVINAIRDVWAITRLAGSADAVLAFDEPGVLAADLLARRLKVPCLVILHGTYAVTTLRGRMGRFYRRAYNHASALMFVSRYTRERFTSVFPEHHATLKLMPLGVDTNFVVDAPPGFKMRRREILTVGEVKPRKGLLQTVKALALIPKERRPTIIVAGLQSPTNTYVKDITDMAHSLGVQLVFLGQVPSDELERLYLRALAFVLPSQNVGDHFEGFGLVHLEAAARGLPAIGTRECGNEDVIVDGVTGHLCGQQDAAELAACIDTLMSDEIHWLQCSLEAIKRAKTMTWSKTTDILIESIDMACAK